MNTDMKFVDFKTYCTKCKYWMTSEYDSPCNECLMNPTNEHSTKPVNFEKADSK